MLKFKIRVIGTKILGRLFSILNQEVIFWGKSRQTYNEDGLWTQHAHDFIADETFLKSINRAIQVTGGIDYSIAWRTHVYIWATNRQLTMQGDFVELGVGKGWMVSAALASIEWTKAEKTWWLIDRFQPNEVDAITGEVRAHLKSNRYAVSADLVKANFDGYERIKFVEGTIPETLVNLTSVAISFLHIDLNAAQPEVEALEILWPRIIAGGIVLLDDFGHPMHELQKDAMKDLSIKLDFNILYLPTGQGLILK